MVPELCPRTRQHNARLRSTVHLLAPTHLALPWSRSCNVHNATQNHFYLRYNPTTYNYARLSWDCIWLVTHSLLLYPIQATDISLNYLKIHYIIPYSQKHSGLRQRSRCSDSLQTGLFEVRTPREQNIPYSPHTRLDRPTHGSVQCAPGDISWG
jgi:hypothetical protein